MCVGHMDGVGGRVTTRSQPGWLLRRALGLVLRAVARAGFGWISMTMCGGYYCRSRVCLAISITLLLRVASGSADHHMHMHMCMYMCMYMHMDL